MYFNNPCARFILLVLLLQLLGVVQWSSASFPPGTVLDIQLGDVVIEQFSYIPTRGGYEFG